jgi:hypothetical protein
VLCTPTQKLRVYVTHDLGQAWTRTGDLAVVPPPVLIIDPRDPSEDGYANKPQPNNFAITRPRVAYGPTGVLAVMWRQAYGPPRQQGRAANGPQDVFLALSADRGMHFGAPTRPNTAASPPPDPRRIGGQDLSHMVLDERFAYTVWDDWRSGEMQAWFRKVRLPAR